MSLYIPCKTGFRKLTLEEGYSIDHRMNIYPTIVEQFRRWLLNVIPPEFRLGRLIAIEGEVATVSACCVHCSVKITDYHPEMDQLIGESLMTDAKKQLYEEYAITVDENNVFSRCGTTMTFGECELSPVSQELLYIGSSRVITCHNDQYKVIDLQPGDRLLFKQGQYVLCSVTTHDASCVHNVLSTQYLDERTAKVWEVIKHLDAIKIRTAHRQVFVTTKKDTFTVRHLYNYHPCMDILNIGCHPTVPQKSSVARSVPQAITEQA